MEEDSNYSSSPINATGSDTSANAAGNIDKDQLTEFFLNGQISFAEYSSQWYEKDDDDDEEESTSKTTTQPIEKGNFPKRKKHNKLSAALLGLMGEANLRFVRGDKDTAELMCYEIIKQVPTAPEPYQTLAQIYEDTDADKSLQFSLLAAHLGPPDASEWLRLAAVSHEKNDLKQEMLCFTQAIRAERQNLDIHLKRLSLLQYLEEINYPPNVIKVTAVKCYHKIVNCLPATESDSIMKYMKLAAHIYHKNEEHERALEVMAAAHKKCAALFTLEDTNLYLELLMGGKQYQTCIDIFVASIGIEIEAEIQTVSVDGKLEEITQYLNCTLPDNVPIDLRCKLLICFIYLGAIDIVKKMINDFLITDIDKTGDLLLDVEEALNSVGLYDLALQILDHLINREMYKKLGVVWLKHAECLQNLGRNNEAINSYYKVLELAPQNFEAKEKLFKILESMNKIDAAFDVVQQDHKFAVSAKLLYEEFILLKKSNNIVSYLRVGEKLLSKSFFRFKHMDELKLSRLSKGARQAIYNRRLLKNESEYCDDDIHFDEDEEFSFTPEEEWEIFLDLMKTAYEHKKYYMMQRLSFGANMSKNLQSHKADIDFYCIQSSLANNDPYDALIIIRDYVQKRRTPRLWNLLNYVGQYCDEVNIKYLWRVFQKFDCEYKYLFLGNNFLLSGRYDETLKYLLKEPTKDTNPLINLMIAISLLLLGTQRTIHAYNPVMLQGISYLIQYEKLRGCDQEALYNIGRAYQMLSINNLAIEYYERALACPPVATCKKHGVIDLTKVIAFNLVVLCKEHSPDVARVYLNKYLVI